MALKGYVGGVGTLVVISAVCVLADGSPHPGERNSSQLPQVVIDVLEDSPEIVLASVDPKTRLERFDGRDRVTWRERGRVAITDRWERRALLSVLYGAIAEGEASGIRGACFNPRHSLTARVDDMEVRLWICFECRGVVAEAPSGGDRADTLISGSAGTFFDALLRVHGMRVPKRRKLPEDW